MTRGQAPARALEGAIEPLDFAVALPAGCVGRGVRVRDPERTAAFLEDPGAAHRPGPNAVAWRRAEFWAGRWCATAALAALGCGAPVGRADDGAPVWPDGFVGSITHTHGHVLVVVAPRTTFRAVGVDVERLATDAVAAEAGPGVLTAAERAVLARALGDDAGGFTAGFSAKEALYKCLYPLAGQLMGFDAARVVAADGDALTLELARAWAPALPAGRRFPVRYARTAHGVETFVALP
jgi:enterobactin synthetase component D